MIVVYDKKLEIVIPDRESLEKRITQAIDMIEYYKMHVAQGDPDQEYQAYCQKQVNGLLSEIVRLCAFREEFDKLESLENGE